jgi:hypothetical protein
MNFDDATTTQHLSLSLFNNLILNLTIIIIKSQHVTSTISVCGDKRSRGGVCSLSKVFYCSGGHDDDNHQPSLSYFHQQFSCRPSTKHVAIVFWYFNSAKCFTLEVLSHAKPRATRHISTTFLVLWPTRRRPPEFGQHLWNGAPIGKFPPRFYR